MIPMKVRINYDIDSGGIDVHFHQLFFHGLSGFLIVGHLGNTIRRGSAGVNDYMVCPIRQVKGHYWAFFLSDDTS